jgi:hypothetical protein
VEAEPLNVTVTVTVATARMPFFQAPLLFWLRSAIAATLSGSWQIPIPQFRKAWWQANIA